MIPLASASGQLSELLADLCYDEWVREMVQEHLTLARELDEVLEELRQWAADGVT